MAIVTVDVTDEEPVPTRWEMPPNYASLQSPIPRGIIQFRGTDPIALLGSGDETSYKLTLTMPAGAAYLPKVIMVRYDSDDLDLNFNDNGFGFYVRAKDPEVLHFVMASGGEVINNANLANKIWAPLPVTPKVVLAGGDTMGLRFADMTAGGSTAGDMGYYVDFYAFDIDQVDKWQVNTPIPIISHTSF